MTSFPTTYNSESAWKAQQNELLTQQMETLDSFQSPTSQLIYIMTQFAYFCGDSASDALAWRARDENIASGVFDADVATITNSYNDVISHGSDPQYAQQELGDVDTAMDAANQALWYAFTCPPFSENTDMQTLFVNNLSDLFECQPTWNTYMITTDGVTSPVSVPQFDPHGVENGVTNDENTLDYWTGNFWDAPTPNEEGYQSYLTAQSEWNQDLTMMSDSTGNLDAQMQASMQQNEEMEQQIYGNWNDMIQQKTKGVAYQINKQLSE